MTDLLQKSCDRGDIETIYYIFLSREAEPDNVFIGAELLFVVKEILSSAEFSGLADRWLDGDLLPRGPVDGKSIEGAKRLLRALDAPRPRTDTHPDILLAALKFFRPRLDQGTIIDLVDRVISVIEEEYVGPLLGKDGLKQFIYFDEELFFRQNPSLFHLKKLPAEELETYVVRAVMDGDAEVSPFFCIAGADRRAVRDRLFGDLKAKSKITLAMLLARMRTAAWEGTIGHWLFEAGYYTANRDQAFREARVPQWHVSPNDYIDYLFNGDQNDIRPHALFCPVTYRELNGLADIERPFGHFLTEGHRQGLVSSMLFDTQFYLAMSPTVVMDLHTGRFQSALESFWREGCAAGRPFLPDFDRHHYLSINEDVANLYASDNSHNPEHHFLMHGAREGRGINKYFDASYYLTRYPQFRKLCHDWNMAPIEHFLLFGRKEGLRSSKPLIDRTVDVFQAKTLYERRALDSYIRQTRRPLDFTSVIHDDPVISVIVPVHNQISFTARFLELAFQACAELYRRDGLSAEIIVVSNGSLDGTDDFLARIRGIKTVITSQALGYPGAANAGAKIATGRLLLVVNNDIEFEAGVFADIVTSFDAEPGCGAIGPCILSMDLTIQEVGAFIAGDGGTFGLSRGERSSQHVTDPKEKVDYVSGCFLAVERKDFEALGGFDNIFSPGYYEEVDLCLRIKKELGKDTYVDPSIIITHYEHASFLKGRPPTVSYPVILRNRRYFLNKHPEIADRPSAEMLRSARMRAQIGYPQTRILVIEDLIPDPRLGSGFGRAAEILRGFHDLGIRYDVFARHASLRVDEYEYPDVTLFRGWLPGESLEEVLQSSHGRYSHIWVCRSHNLALLSDMLKNYKEKFGSYIVCDTEAVSVQRTIELGRLNGRDYGAQEVSELVAAELNASSVVDLFIAVNQRDTDLIRSAKIDRVMMISHTVSGVVKTSRAWNEREHIMMVGAVHSPLSPNFDAVKWFMQSVYPRIMDIGKPLIIVGHWEEGLRDDILKRYPKSPITFTGMVSEQELRQIYDKAVVAIAPTRYAAGIPCKVVEAMLTGIPIVMSTLLGDQIGFTPQERETMAIASVSDDGEDFADALRRLVTDATWWNDVSATQLQVAETRYDLDALRKQIVDVLDRVGIKHLQASGAG